MWEFDFHSIDLCMSSKIMGGRVDEMMSGEPVLILCHPEEMLVALVLDMRASASYVMLH